MLKTNYHTHCTFCDGKNTMEEMVISAIDSNFDILGFSSHAMKPFSDMWHIKTDKYDDYTKTFYSFKDKYSNKIELYLGFEADYIQNLTSPSIDNYKEYNPDYIIGSVHYVPGGSREEGFYEADGDGRTTLDNIRRLYGDDVEEAVTAYFEAERNMIYQGGFTFIGHCDLIRKQLSYSKLFNEEDFWYKEQLKLTAKAISSSGMAVEVNTGGMARGYMSTPYPSMEFLTLMHDYNIPVTINSDTHNISTVDYGFEQAKELIKKAGYKEVCFFSAGRLKMQNL